MIRYLKLKGKDVAFICGSDEHGVPITLRARKEGVSPQDIVDKYHKMIKKAFADFGIDFDIYHLHHPNYIMKQLRTFSKPCTKKASLLKRRRTILRRKEKQF